MSEQTKRLQRDCDELEEECLDAIREALILSRRVDALEERAKDPLSVYPGWAAVQPKTADLTFVTEQQTNTQERIFDVDALIASLQREIQEITTHQMSDWDKGYASGMQDAIAHIERLVQAGSERTDQSTGHTDPAGQS